MIGWHEAMDIFNEPTILKTSIHADSTNHRVAHISIHTVNASAIRSIVGSSRISYCTFEQSPLLDEDEGEDESLSVRQSRLQAAAAAAAQRSHQHDDETVDDTEDHAPLTMPSSPASQATSHTIAPTYPEPPFSSYFAPLPSHDIWSSTWFHGSGMAPIGMHVAAPVIALPTSSSPRGRPTLVKSSLSPKKTNASSSPSSSTATTTTTTVTTLSATPGRF
jgi:hypothetical protein